jgi:multidrug efflux system membrane fusion protein
VRQSTAREITRTIEVSARTEPDRAVEIKAETEGRVVAVGADRGSAVTTGQTLVELDVRDRNALLAEADALIRQRELEFDAAEQLRGQQFISPAELAGREAQLIAAQAARSRIALDLEKTQIQAPFAALVYDRLVEVGDYVAIGDPIAQLVDADPLIVVGNINERDIGALEVGAIGRASILGGPVLEGSIRYIAPAADESTRSFRVELAIPNRDLALKSGTSARLLLRAEQITAHEISPGIIWLADDGAIGVKIVDSADRVRFVPIEIAESTSDSVLVTGLPVEARIITVGQGFVVDGQAVIPREAENAALTRAPRERPY